MFCSGQKIIAQDTLSSEKDPERVFRADPQRATMLAITLPGLGQIYNRKYWKVPFVYAGFGGLIYGISYNSKIYNSYMKAYQDFIDAIPETDSYIGIIKNADPSTYDPVLYPDTYNPSATEWYKELMIKQIDYNKKYRDLSYIGIAVWYLITVIDANVDASLYNYDISDNLELALSPALLTPATGGGMGLNLVVTF